MTGHRIKYIFKILIEITITINIYKYMFFNVPLKL